MGLEYIVQPQVFLGGLTALGPGIQGLTEQYPLLTTYYSWTSTASVNVSSFPIPIDAGSIYEGPGKESSFIVSVGGVIQPPTQYTVDPTLRTITFNTTGSIISAGIEFAATQLATAAPSSQDFDYIKSVSAEFITLSALNGTIDTLVVTGLTATDLTTTNLSASNLTATNLTVTDLATTNLTATDLTTTNLTVTDLTTTNLSASNLTATNALINGLSATVHSYSLGSYTSTTDGDETMDASVASRGSWIADFTDDRTLDILNLTSGQEVLVYVSNTNGTARTITVRASTTTTGATNINFAREGAASVTGISLAISTGTAVFWVANINGTFVGSI
jgi:trimeric autotransporter adhesin